VASDRLDGTPLACLRRVMINYADEEIAAAALDVVGALKLRRRSPIGKPKR